MKKATIVLLYCQVRYGNFGIGTYISNLLALFKNKNSEFRIIIVYTDDKTEKLITTKFIDEVESIHIPQPENKIFLTSSQNFLQYTYAKRISELVHRFIKGYENPVIFVNSIDYINVVNYLKVNYNYKILLN